MAGTGDRLTLVHPGPESRAPSPAFALAAGLACSVSLHLAAVAALEWMPLGVRSGVLSTTHRGHSELRAFLAPGSLAAGASAAPLDTSTHAPATGEPAGRDGTAPDARRPAESLVPAEGTGRRQGAASEAPFSPLPAQEYLLSRELDGKPGPLARIEPEYPPAGATRSLSGSVVLRLYINERGSVDRVEIVRASEAAFEEAARRAFLEARFTPGIKDGRAVKSQVALEISFQAPEAGPLPSGLPGQAAGK